MNDSSSVVYLIYEHFRFERRGGHKRGGGGRTQRGIIFSKKKSFEERTSKKRMEYLGPEYFSDLVDFSTNNL